MKVDVLLIHVPKMLEWSPLTGWYSRINFISQGVFTIASALDQAGISCRILHAGVAKQRDPGWSLVEAVRASGARVAAFSLHWHPQMYDTIEAARAVAEALPEVDIVLGGLTATAFADEILETWPFVDAVLSGEGEVPLVRYVQARQSGTPLSGVPNLAWRDGDRIRHAPGWWVSSGSDLDRFGLGGWDRLDDAAGVLAQGWRYYWNHDEQPDHPPTVFGLMLGRGCLGTCTWCAGSYGAMKRATGRRRTAWRSADNVAAQVARLQGRGVQRVYTCFDPHPGKTDEVLALLDALGKLPDKIVLDFETFGLPSDDVVDSFAKNTAPGSALIISPETADEGLRRKHRAFPFSNAALEATIARAQARSVRVDLYFIVGLPGEDARSIRRTAAYQAALKARFGNIAQVMTWPLEVEPGAPWSTRPDDFGVRLRRKSAADFYDAHRQREMSLGYDTELLSEAALMALFERFFVPLSKAQRAMIQMHFRPTRDWPPHRGRLRRWA